MVFVNDDEPGKTYGILAEKNVIADFFYYSALIVDNYLGLGFEVSK